MMELTEWIFRLLLSTIVLGLAKLSSSESGAFAFKLHTLQQERNSPLVWDTEIALNSKDEGKDIRLKNEYRSFSSPKSKRLGDAQLTVKELFLLLDTMQVKIDKPYIAPEIAWEEHKGMYPSYVRLNFVGRPEVSELRELISVFDNNMFATAWISICLLEAHAYAGAPAPSATQLRLSLDAIHQHRDRNRPYNNSVMAFWPQAYEKNASLWVSTPANLLHSFDVFENLPWDQIDKILEKLGLQNVEKFLKWIERSRSGYTRAFHIPPDFDDTTVNLGLGALLMDLGQELPDALDRWRGHNLNLTSVLDAMKKYAYRPFSSDKDINTIDPRTYYYIRHFLNDAYSKGQDVALVPTWVQDIPEAHQYIFRDVVMPFQVNNVDVTVSANAVYGLTGAVLSGLLPESVLQDPDIRQIYRNTTSLIAFMVEKRLFDRPDLALTYYPSVFEFYWFVARTYHRMETTLQTKALPQAMQDLYGRLKEVLEGPMTLHVVESGTPEGDDMLYYDDFLGNADLDKNNNTLKKAEDRLYTTTMAANALLTTWTLYNSTSRTNRWKTDTPVAVKTTVDKCVAFLSKYILHNTYKPWNAFFSGSAKGRTTYPSSYPGNRLELLNGTDVPITPKRPHDEFMYGMEGYVTEQQYQVMINETHFGEKTPTEFVTYNDPQSFFPFWSSPAYTYATTMLVLGRYDNIEN